MSKGLKGITVKIDGDTKPLNQALSKVNSETKSLQGELKGINSLLKFDPKNTELLAQKQTVLTQAIEQTENKLKTLKQAQKEMSKAGKDVNDEGYRDLQREIVATTHRLEELKKQRTTFETLKQGVKDFTKTIGEAAMMSPKINKLATGFQNVKQKITETVKESAAVQKIGSAVEGARQKVEAFKNAHPHVKKVADAFQTMKEKADELKSKLPSLHQSLAAVGNAAAGAAKGGFKALEVTIGATIKGFAGFTTAIATVGMASIKVGSEFETAMSQVAATMGVTKDTIAEDGTKPFEILSNAAKEAGKSTKFSASEAAEALNYLALAGYDASTAAEVLPSVLNLAAAGGIDLAYASDLATDAMSALGIEASNENLTNFGDKLAVTAQKSNTSVSQLGEAITTVGATAKGLAGGTTELNTALGILADSGIKGAEGGTKLRNVILSLQTPTNAAASALEKYTNGVYDAEGNMRPLNDVLGELNTSLSKMTQEGRAETINQIFNKEDMAAAQVLLAGCATDVKELGAAFNSAGIDINSIGVSIDELAASFDTTLTQEEYAAKAMSEYGVTAEQAGVMYSGFMGILSESGSRFDELSGYINSSAGAMQNMADTMNDNLQGQITILKSGLEGLGISIYEDMQEPLKDTVIEAQKIIEQLQNSFDSEGFTGLITGIANVIDQLITSLAEKLGGMSDKLLPPLIQAFFTLVKTVTGALPTLLPQIINAAITLFGGLLQGLNETIPQIMAMLPTIIQTISQTLIANLPQLITAGVQILVNLINGITQAIPSLISAIVELIPVIVQTVMENLPLIIEAGLNLLMSLISGIVQAIPQLVAMLPTIINTIVSQIVSMLPQIIQTGIQLLNSLVSGIIQAIPQLIAALPQIITSIVNTIIANLPKIIQTGIELLGALISGIIQAIPSLVAALPQVFSAIIDTFKGVNWADLGKNIIDGVINGVKNAASNLLEVFKELANSALDSVKETLGIHSPSTVFRDEVGKQIPAGMAQGVEDGMDEQEARIKAAIQRGVPTTIDGYIKSGGSSYGGESVRAAGGGDFVQNLTINSPRELSPSETARLNRNAVRQTVLKLKPT